MTESPLSILTRYKKALEHLEGSENLSSPKQALDILLARDALQKALKSEVQVPASSVLKIMELDTRLKQQADKLTQVFNGTLRIQMY